ncbi:MAG TPA: thermonuclease family protein [Syntrophaceae bacterium]|nr:thermonuclease family protein [Syntrophaceae bacterium]
MYKKYLLIVLAILVLLPGVSFSKEEYVVKRVIDGDTLLLDNGERVGLLGVYAPVNRPHNSIEIVRQRYEKALAFVRSLVKSGDRIRLEYDWQREDEYGRILAYVFLEDGTFLNEEVIKQGYGQVYTRFPCKYTDDFRRHEREARLHKRGLWGESPEYGN